MLSMVAWKHGGGGGGELGGGGAGGRWPGWTEERSVEWCRRCPKMISSHRFDYTLVGSLRCCMIV